MPTPSRPTTFNNPLSADPMAAVLAQFRAMGDAMTMLAELLERGGESSFWGYGPPPRLLTAEEFATRMGVELETANYWCRNGRYPYARMSFNNKRVGWRIPEGYLYGDELPLEQARWFERFWREQEASREAAGPLPRAAEPASNSQPDATTMAEQDETESSTPTAGEVREPELVAAGTAAEFDVNSLDLECICQTAGRGKGAAPPTPSTGRPFGNRRGDRKGASAAAREREKVS